MMRRVRDGRRYPVESLLEPTKFRPRLVFSRARRLLGATALRSTTG
jgi:hypothetical protein